jgi:hypothetical protein
METAAAAPMVDQIEALLEADDSTLARVEDTLTAGYARALALEGEVLRLERELGQLRSLLGTLHDRARVLRAAAG